MNGSGRNARRLKPSAALLALAILCPAWGWSQAQLTLPDTTAGPSDTLAIPIRVAFGMADSVFSAQFDLSYDTTLLAAFHLSLDGATFPGIAGWELQFNLTAGGLAAALAGPEGLTGNGVLATLWIGIDAAALPGQSSILHIDSPVFNEGDPSATSQDGSVTIFIPVANAAPQALDDSIMVQEDSTTTIAVLANDSDADGDTLRVYGVDTTETTGSVAIDPGDTSITYDPAPDFNGADLFSYSVWDGRGGFDTATVHITIQPVNDPLGAFALVSPGHDSTLVISDENVATDTLVFSWEEATDADGDEISYYGEFNSATDMAILVVLGATTSNEARVSYSELASRLENLGQSTFTGAWNIFASDGWVDSTWSTNGPFTLTIDASTLDVLRQELLPQAYTIHPAFPNPFNPSTTLRYDLPARAGVTLTIYDIRGREVARIVDKMQLPGYHQVNWNGRDRAGWELPTGIYIARLVTLDFRKSIKIMLLK